MVFVEKKVILCSLGRHPNIRCVLRGCLCKQFKQQLWLAQVVNTKNEDIKAYLKGIQRGEVQSKLNFLFQIKNSKLFLRMWREEQNDI
ncbi:unnamed protein product (macronuclear) [Paramecium tetraurelia]|uniref:Uncharacterized protein n=1 Tax=Paramecium tetraurelia TaxID=5888 RepID=A0CAQ4_PARTE|nr:uncharacterized protein GSPATT00036652001 [Paramecium tetraurelia]CAK67871.1 unnamed protein product [Paramecium tetraurelia]|eukprot:XP_001435268.1 hypothetical protein (macronuclear) [Paramecium tetraurelia strain d4-2]